MTRMHCNPLLTEQALIAGKPAPTDTVAVDASTLHTHAITQAPMRLNRVEVGPRSFEFRA